MQTSSKKSLIAFGRASLQQLPIGKKFNDPGHFQKNKQIFINKTFPFLILVVVMIYSCTSTQQKVDKVEDKTPEFLNKFLTKQPLANASIGLFAANSETGNILIDYNGGKSLIPASVQKLLIAGAALETFGPDFTFETSLAYDGKITANGTLNGDIVIIGHSDPALASSRFSEHYGNVILNFKKAITDAGIKKINGKVIGDASWYGDPKIPDTWIWEDIGNYYGAIPSGLNLYENTYQLSFESGKPGSKTTISGIDPSLPWLSFYNEVKAANDNRDNAYIFGSYFSNVRRVRGTIPANRKNFTIKGAIDDPAYLAAHQLTEALIKSGVTISGEAESRFTSQAGSVANVLFTIQSPPLSEIIFYLNMNSINLYAETLLLQLAKKKNGSADFESACETLNDFWKAKGMDSKGMFLKDGSGLSRANSLTAGQLVFLLSYMKNESKYADQFIKSLPVAGKSGSLKSFGKASEIAEKFVAKSGYMSRVMNYAGYLKTNEGKDLIVVVLVNNYTCTNVEMKSLLEDLISGISKHDIDK